MAKFHFDSTYNSEESSKSVTSIMQDCLYDVTDFAICGFCKNTKIKISPEQNIFSSNKKNTHQGLLHDKKYFCSRGNL